MVWFYGITALALLVSLIRDIHKTGRALQIAAKRFIHVLPDLFLMIGLVSLALTLIPDRAILRYLGQENRMLSSLAAVFFGSITLMPGFIAFPLCGILLQKGVSYFVLALFSTTLMMVGVTTFPLERAYFGSWVAILRNVIGLVIALLAAVAIGMAFGELP